MKDSGTKRVARWFGYDRDNLSSTWKDAVDRFVKPGGSAEQKLGKIKSVDIKDVTFYIHASRDKGPVHKSHFNPADTQDVISARIEGKNGTKICHIYEDGTGTTKKGGQRD